MNQKIDIYQQLTLYISGHAYTVNMFVTCVIVSLARSYYTHAKDTFIHRCLEALILALLSVTIEPLVMTVWHEVLGFPENQRLGMFISVFVGLASFNEIKHFFKKFLNAKIKEKEDENQ